LRTTSTHQHTQLSHLERLIVFRIQFLQKQSLGATSLDNGAMNLVTRNLQVRVPIRGENKKTPTTPTKTKLTSQIPAVSQVPGAKSGQHATWQQHEPKSNKNRPKDGRRCAQTHADAMSNKEPLLQRRNRVKTNKLREFSRLLDPVFSGVLSQQIVAHHQIANQALGKLGVKHLRRFKLARKTSKIRRSLCKSTKSTKTF
jgi:hypothetical protein